MRKNTLYFLLGTAVSLGAVEASEDLHYMSSLGLPKPQEIQNALDKKMEQSKQINQEFQEAISLKDGLLTDPKKALDLLNNNPFFSYPSYYKGMFSEGKEGAINDQNICLALCNLWNYDSLYQEEMRQKTSSGLYNESGLAFLKSRELFPQHYKDSLDLLKKILTKENFDDFFQYNKEFFEKIDMTYFIAMYGFSLEPGLDLNFREQERLYKALRVVDRSQSQGLNKQIADAAFEKAQKTIQGFWKKIIDEDNKSMRYCYYFIPDFLREYDKDQKVLNDDLILDLLKNMKQEIQNFKKSNSGQKKPNSSGLIEYIIKDCTINDRKSDFLRSFWGQNHEFFKQNPAVVSSLEECLLVYEGLHLLNCAYPSFLEIIKNHGTFLDNLLKEAFSLDGKGHLQVLKEPYKEIVGLFSRISYGKKEKIFQVFKDETMLRMIENLFQALPNDDDKERIKIRDIKEAILQKNVLDAGLYQRNETFFEKNPQIIQSIENFLLEAMEANLASDGFNRSKLLDPMTKIPVLKMISKHEFSFGKKLQDAFSLDTSGQMKDLKKVHLILSLYQQIIKKDSSLEILDDSIILKMIKNLSLITNLGEGDEKNLAETKKILINTFLTSRKCKTHYDFFKENLSVIEFFKRDISKFGNSYVASLISPFFSHNEIIKILKKSSQDFWWELQWNKNLFQGAILKGAEILGSQEKFCLVKMLMKFPSFSGLKYIPQERHEDYLRNSLGMTSAILKRKFSLFVLIKYLEEIKSMALKNPITNTEDKKQQSFWSTETKEQIVHNILFFLTSWENFSQRSKYPKNLIKLVKPVLEKIKRIRRAEEEGDNDAIIDDEGWERVDIKRKKELRHNQDFLAFLKNFPFDVRLLSKFYDVWKREYHTSYESDPVIKKIDKLKVRHGSLIKPFKPTPKQ